MESKIMVLRKEEAKQNSSIHILFLQYLQILIVILRKRSLVLNHLNYKEG